MKLLFIISVLFFPQVLLAQIKIGTYKIIRDNPIIPGIEFSSLILRENKTFTYEYRTSLGGSVSFDIHGKWAVRNNTLKLKDRSKHNRRKGHPSRTIEGDYFIVK